MLGDDSQFWQRHLIREALTARMEAAKVDRTRVKTGTVDFEPDNDDELSTARVLNDPFFAPGAQARRRATWERLRGGAHHG